MDNQKTAKDTSSPVILRRLVLDHPKLGRFIWTGVPDLKTFGAVRDFISFRSPHQLDVVDDPESYVCVEYDDQSGLGYASMPGLLIKNGHLGEH